MARFVVSLVGAVLGAMMDLNFLYYAMGGVTLVSVVLVTTVLVRKDVVASEGRIARFAGRIQGSWPAVLIMAITTLVVGVQGAFESTVHDALGWDFTWVVYAIEGQFVQTFQDTLRNPILDWVFTAVYTVGAFWLYHLPFWFCVLTGRSRSALIVALSLAGIWIVGILAYFFLPVFEVWVTSDAPYNYGHVVNVLFDTMPSTRDSPYYMAAINNNFPSLHVGTTMGVVLALRYAGERKMFRFLFPFAAGVALATMYLGIHWVLDVIAGILLAWGAAVLATRIADKQAVSFGVSTARPASEGSDVEPGSR